MDFVQNYWRLAVGLLVLAGLAIAGYYIYFFISIQGKTAVTIYAVPNDATITLLDQNGKTSFGHTGINYLKPGKYKVSFQKNGFSSSSATLDTNSNPLTPVVASLSAQTAAAKKWLSEHQDQVQKASEETEQISILNQKKAQQDFDIASALPYQDPYYTIGYTLNTTPQKVSVTTESPQYRYAAIQQIRNMGYNPDDYGIVFYNFTNPLTGKVGN